MNNDYNASDLGYDPIIEAYLAACEENLTETDEELRLHNGILVPVYLVKDLPF